MRKTLFLLFGLATLALFSCNEKAKLANSLSTAVSPEAIKHRKLDSLGTRYNELGRFSGSIFVAQDGKLAYNNFFGKADYESNTLFSETTVFSLGSFTEIMMNNTNEQRQEEIKTDSLENETRKAILALIKELDLQNTFLQKEAPKNAATGHVHNIGPGGPETTPATLDSELQLWTNATNLQKMIAALAVDDLVQDGYSNNGGFSFAIRKKGDLSIIILSNRRHPVAGEMAENIEKLWREIPYQLPLPRKEIKVPSSLLDEFAGSYELGPKNDLKVISENDSLFILMGPQKVHLKAQSNNQFFMEQADSAIRFKKDSLNHVVTAELLDGFLSGQEIPKRN